MRYREIFDAATTQNATVFDFTFSASKIKEDGSTVTKSYSINIPNDYAWQYCGRKKPNDLVKAVYKNETTTAEQKLQRFKQILAPIIDSNRFKWAALIDSMSLYFNPLWNVDGTEETRSNMAARKTTETIGEREDENIYGATEQTENLGSKEDSITHGAQDEETKFGNGSSYYDEVQYGATKQTLKYGEDKTTDDFGVREKTSEHKVKPFNDLDGYKDTDKTIEGDDAAQDVHTREEREDEVSSILHTDRNTHGAHSDRKISEEYEDTMAYGSQQNKRESKAHTDTLTKGEQENITEQDAYIDVVTVKRQGNIGVTKSTDLLDSYRQLMTDIYPIILDDIMKIVSRGY